MSDTHSTGARSAYPWFSFERTPEDHDGMDESKSADELTLGILLDRYAFACRKLGDLTDVTPSSGKQRDVAKANR